MAFEPPSEPDWTYVLETVLPRLGMWTGRATYERAVCFIEGFDTARGRRVAPLLADWARERYGATNAGWPWVLLRLSLGTARDELDGRDLGDLTVEEDKEALALLSDALRDVVDTL